MLNGLVTAVKNIQREYADYERLLDPSNKRLRRLVFYGESGIFYRYYEDYINYILANSDFEICYITSDLNDPIFAIGEPRIRPFYIKTLLSGVFAALDSKVLVLATPDLNQGAFKRAREGVHHIYAFRGVSSTHLGYRLGAFDNYDSILCVAQYQIDEIRKGQELFPQRAKELVLTGYPLIERIWREHRQFKTNQVRSQNPICLIAPTWSAFLPETSILDNCIEPMLESLAGSPYQVWLRPHPEYAKRFPKKLEAISKIIKRSKNILLQTELSSMECVHLADVLITDHSAISMEFVLGTERPVLMIDTPLRLDNPEWKRYNLEPVEITHRAQLGACLSPENVHQVVQVLDELLVSTSEFAKTVPDLRARLIANWQGAAEAGGQHILRKCN